MERERKRKEEDRTPDKLVPNSKQTSFLLIS